MRGKRVQFDDETWASIDLLAKELSVTMALTGKKNLREIDRQVIVSG